jgi:hypothetical protein
LNFLSKTTSSSRNIDCAIFIIYTISASPGSSSSPDFHFFLSGSSFKDKGNENVAPKMAAENERKDNITTLTIFSGWCNYF